MKSCCESKESTGIFGFLLGSCVGILLGVLVGQCCPSRRAMKKMARRTAHSVNDAMDHLRETLHQYL